MKVNLIIQEKWIDLNGIKTGGGKMKKFIEDYILGEVSQDDIYDYVTQWHESDSKLPLHEYLGLTSEEYSDWLTTSEISQETEDKYEKYYNGYY